MSMAWRRNHVVDTVPNLVVLIQAQLGAALDERLDLTRDRLERKDGHTRSVALSNATANARSGVLEQLQQPRLVEHRHAQALGVGEL